MISHISVKVYCHGSSNMLSLPFPLMLAKFFAPSKNYLCFLNTLKPVLPWESTIPTYGLSKILQVSCHVASNKNCSLNMYDLLVWEKISFIRSCDMEVIKVTDCIIKVHITSGNIKWRSFALRFCASNHKSTWQPLLPSSKGLSFTLCKSQGDLHLSFLFYPLASTLCWKDPDTYIQLDVR